MRTSRLKPSPGSAETAVGVDPRVLTLTEAHGKTCGVLAACSSRGTITKFWYPTTASSKANTGTTNAGCNHANQPELLETGAGTLPETVSGCSDRIPLLFSTHIAPNPTPTPQSPPPKRSLPN